MLLVPSASPAAAVRTAQAVKGQRHLHRGRRFEPIHKWTRRIRHRAGTTSARTGAATISRAALRAALRAAARSRTEPELAPIQIKNPEDTWGAQTAADMVSFLGLGILLAGDS